MCSTFSSWQKGRGKERGDLLSEKGYASPLSYPLCGVGVKHAEQWAHCLLKYESSVGFRPITVVRYITLLKYMEQGGDLFGGGSESVLDSLVTKRRFQGSN